MPQHHNRSVSRCDRLEAVQDKKEDKKVVDDASDQGMVINDELVYMPLLEEDESSFSKLPYDMIHVISQYMHLFDYGNFRASCKTFRAAVPPIPQCRPINMLPLFISFKNEDGLCQVMDPSRDDSQINNLRLSTDPFTVCFSKYGWLITSTCLQDSTNFFNLFTRVRGNFPPSYDLIYYDIRSIGFSTNPTSPDSVIVAFAVTVHAVNIYYMQYGYDTWIECMFPSIDNKFDVGTSSLVYFEGAFYVLDTIGNLGAFEVVDGEGSWQVYNRPPIDIDTMLHSYHLVECNRELVGVFIGYMGIWVEVFKFNFSKEKWVKVTSLGNYSLFLSQQSSCFSAETTEVEMRNRFYLSMLKGNAIVFYSLDTKKFHITGSEDASEDFYDMNMTEPLHCFWL